MRLILAAVVFALTGCATTAPPSEPRADAPNPTAGSPTPTPTDAATPQRRGTAIRLADSPFGRVLFDRSGQAIYLFDLESSKRPRCYGACADEWPPVLTDGPPVAVGEVRAGLLGTTRRTDGSTQVTYAGHPLYYYAHEGKYQVLCHDFVEYGGTWFAIAGNGGRAPS